ncbi:sugar phosphate isomerase/epimerase family protein [Chryseolinea sp. H1M3-3]|uniref:sugar phosphate isomerase/epimerase family protein n=1 Tax=Chryseolinea sp. H1M3-3 TaxID=3034144 RepID=UPI0023EB03D2|nr:sugar phosphate isomerase/epimerase family protein [Chryseolinea sp. H1M3-3]
MSNPFKRRTFIQSFLAVPILTTAGVTINTTSFSQDRNVNSGKGKLKLSLNAFSFNGPLMEKKMTLDQLLETCAEIGFDGVDITGYYFPGYPNVPPDEYLYHVKRKAFRLGLDITGTGVRNDFTDPNKNKRSEHVTLVKNWIDAASKLGAPVIRIFAGTQNPKEYSREQITAWMLADIKECLAYGKQKGVIVAIQNHNDFIMTADHAIEFIEKINSEWFGLILDTGSYRVHDPYAEIAKSAKYAVNWQIKENVFINGLEKEADIPKIIQTIHASGYRGYIPIETLGAGDPKPKVIALYKKVKDAVSQFS